MQKRSEPAEAPRVFDASLAPAHPFWAVGDIHGRIDLLDRLLADIHDTDPDPFVVFVGDYVDRGEHSRDVLERLRTYMNERPGRTVALAGNHESMLLGFIDNPDDRAAKWLRYGGMQTLASFGIGGLTENSRGDSLVRAHAEFVAAFPAETLDWLRALPHHWESGNVHVVHAGADPGKDMAAQRRSTLMWGHPECGRIAREDGQWLVVGHTVVDTPTADNGVVSIDTGACFTGRLTAARFSGDTVTFRTTGVEA